MLITLFFTLPIFAKNTILIVGDSLSAGYGMNIADNWVALLQQRLQKEQFNYQVVNISISGNTTSNGLAQLPDALRQHQPTITIIELGGNDGLRGLQIATIKANLQQMITLAKQAHSKVLLIGVRLPPNYGALYGEQFQQIFIDLAKENQISVVPLFLKNVDDKAGLMSSDGIHPTAQAQVVMLEHVWGVLERML